MEKICPRDGTVCPGEEILEEAYRLARTKEIKIGIIGTAGAVGRQARDGNCDGSERDDATDYCGNSNAEGMRHVYEIQREARRLTEVLPDSITSITRNE